MPAAGGRTIVLGLLLGLVAAAPVHGADDFTFELHELTKKTHEIGGFVEIDGEHMEIREDGAASLLNFRDDPVSTLDRMTVGLQLHGSSTWQSASINWLGKGIAAQDDLGWSDSLDLYEGYATLRPSAEINAAIGKKSYKWGKGYAWNPVGFINRTKDPNNPEEALEGYVAAEAEWIKSRPGDLQNIALTAAIVPVWNDVNEDFGNEDHLNLAAKLYLLYLDTDIDILAFTGDSRTTRFGVDLSRNISSNFEIHGEVAWFADMPRTILRSDGGLRRETGDRTSLLAGIRYLTSFDLTTIIEYYHNGIGYSEAEMERFFHLVDEARDLYLTSGAASLYDLAGQMSTQGYGRPYAGRDYLYARLSLKEPFDILYFTPALTTIINLHDRSFSITPEMAYTGFTNWELLLRLALLNGPDSSDYGEKQNSGRLELRVRYFF
ncbi:hypothetical protein JWG42_02760 [Desulfoprunum benzoelyticum]|uniref:hypothetical protein n=1 Tax=Desulfoprunum benzoelyticum TaxID=1506996 RepID=UPI00160AF343|nr:hypothetical protein [Desulfoprunum benzoelyticum]MBM9529073.1 hypothetical protein [Desulfoprunum benzoelyticum]